VAPYREAENSGNGFTFADYSAEKLLEAVDAAKGLYFGNRDRWNEMICRDLEKDVSWARSAAQYRALYQELAE